MTKNFLTALWNKIKSNFVQKDSSGNVNLSGGYLTGVYSITNSGTIYSNTFSGYNVKAQTINGAYGDSVNDLKVTSISGVSGGLYMSGGNIYMNQGTITGLSSLTMTGTINMNSGGISGLGYVYFTGGISVTGGGITGVNSLYFGSGTSYISGYGINGISQMSGLQYLYMNSGGQINIGSSGSINFSGSNGGTISMNSGTINMQSGSITGINTITMNQLNGYSGTLDVNGNKINIGPTSFTNNLTVWCSGDGEGSIQGLHYLNMHSGIISGVQSINGKNIEFKTQAQYNALSTKDPNTLYVITG